MLDSPYCVAIAALVALGAFTLGSAALYTLLDLRLTLEQDTTKGSIRSPCKHPN